MSIRRDLDSQKLKNDAGSAGAGAGYVSTSKLGFDTFSILWSIQNFSELTDDIFYSPVYRGGPKTDHSWQLYVQPNALNTDDPNDKGKYFSVFLILMKTSGLDPASQKKSVKASYEISLLNRAGEPKKSTVLKLTNPHEFMERHSFGYETYIAMTKLKPAELLMDDILTIQCRICIHLGFEHSTVPEGRLSVPLTEETLDIQLLKQLRVDFKKGFETGAFTDMTLVTKTKTFKTHKFVLAARSSVFKAMLSSKMQEATNNSVKIPDFDEETVESKLRFVYTGEITALSTDQACDLLRMADKYEVLGLKKHLEEVLGNKLDTSNVLKVLVLAEMHSASKLKSAALQFTNKCKEILHKTEGFKKLVQTNPNLLMELYQML